MKPWSFKSLLALDARLIGLQAQSLSPAYSGIGAMATSTLAGSLLIAKSADAWFLNSIAPFIKGFAIFYWPAGTWWIGDEQKGSLCDRYADAVDFPIRHIRYGTSLKVDEVAAYQRNPLDLFAADLIQQLVPGGTEQSTCWAVSELAHGMGRVRMGKQPRLLSRITLMLFGKQPPGCCSGPHLCPRDRPSNNFLSMQLHQNQKMMHVKPGFA